MRRSHSRLRALVKKAVGYEVSRIGAVVQDGADRASRALRSAHARAREDVSRSEEARRAHRSVRDLDLQSRRVLCGGIFGAESARARAPHVLADLHGQSFFGARSA